MPYPLPLQVSYLDVLQQALPPPRSILAQLKVQYGLNYVAILVVRILGSTRDGLDSVLQYAK